MKNFFKKYIGVVLVIVMVCVLAGCSGSCATATRESKYTQQLMSQANDAVGFPDISHFFEKSQLKEIYEMRDDPSLICYWYTKNDINGKWIYQGKCIGYGIPYSTSYTQPETFQRGSILNNDGDVRYSENGIMPQADPNGLYYVGSTSATWVLTQDSKGDIKPTYVESEITVTQTKMDARLCEDWSIPEDYDK